VQVVVRDPLRAALRLDRIRGSLGDPAGEITQNYTIVRRYSHIPPLTTSESGVYSVN
jgi:hypothetical protein